ncbi:Signal recognition particle 19 kDa family protein [Hibiscus syriacus]|uniref:Signal recognition particle 19 kDa family protein n=1 Tax=Hibiscus syriacus TaxID=106335 RepID=A0A6A3CCR7_HIBSY|nr:uncharacterized protein At3g17950-like [Hibiscus syriacus]KAE8726576.1 Signal recognition particle 19 kDa family protein [Hibiscus syriacus]
MLDPASDLLPPTSSPTISSVSSSDLDTESTGSFFHDRSTTLGTLMGVSFPAITFRAPSRHHRETQQASAGSDPATASKPKKRRALTAAFGSELLGRRRRKWWQICRDGDSKPASLGEFLEVERRFGDGAFYGAEAELEGVIGTSHDEHHDARKGRSLFADGRVLPPASVASHPADDDDEEDEKASTAGALCRFPVSLTGICSGGVG